MENIEIKFRVWSGFKMETNIMAGFLGAFYVGGMDEKDTASMSSFNTKYSNSVHVMQFTGLLDKNGKEIYEGDLVEFYHKGENVKCTIIFDNAAFKLKWADGYINNWKLNPEKYTVVGNIYQPELIK